MKRVLIVFCCFLILTAVFLLGWRVMPKIWPNIKEAVVYPVFPQMRPEPAATPEPYTPESDTAFEDPISKTDSVIYYFYKDYCPWCKALAVLTDALPKKIYLSDGTASRVRLVCLNKVEEKYMHIITDYYEAHDIPEDRRYVPAMVIGEQYLFADEEIVPGLMDALVAGEGLKTELLNGQERE